MWCARQLWLQAGDPSTVQGSSGCKQAILPLQRAPLNINKEAPYKHAFNDRVTDRMSSTSAFLNCTREHVTGRMHTPSEIGLVLNCAIAANAREGEGVRKYKERRTLR